MVFRRFSGLAVATLLAVMTLAGCSGDDGGEAATPGSGTGSSSATPGEAGSNRSSGSTSEPTEAETGPGGVVITAPGSEVEIPGAAVVAWDVGGDRAVARIKVTRFERATQKVFQDWVLDKDARNTTPYFVRLQVTNLARTDLGGQVLPIYGAAPDNVLLAPSTFKAEFRACPGAELPAKLKKGASTRSCLVFLAPQGDKLTGASFYPAEGVDPIAWTGTATRYDPTPQKPKKGDKVGD